MKHHLIAIDFVLLETPPFNILNYILQSFDTVLSDFCNFTCMATLKLKKSYCNNQLRDYFTLFERSEVNRWLKNDFSSLDLKIQRYDQKWNNHDLDYLPYIRYFFQVLEKNILMSISTKTTFLTIEF